MANYAGAIWRPINEYDAGGIQDWEVSNRENSYDIQYIIIHTTEGNSAQGAIDWWSGANGGSASAHYIVEDSTIYQTVADKNIAYHAGHAYYTNRSIGIEIVAWANIAGTISDAEYRAAADLVRWLVNEYDISPVHILQNDNTSTLGNELPSGILGHTQVDLPEVNGFKTDPGPYFMVREVSANAGFACEARAFTSLIVKRSCRQMTGIASRKLARAAKRLVEVSELARLSSSVPSRSISSLAREGEGIDLAMIELDGPDRLRGGEARLGMIADAWSQRGGLVC